LEDLLVQVGRLVPLLVPLHLLGEGELLQRRRRVAHVDAAGRILAVKAVGIEPGDRDVLPQGRRRKPRDRGRQHQELGWTDQAIAKLHNDSNAQTPSSSLLRLPERAVSPLASSRLLLSRRRKRGSNGHSRLNAPDSTRSTFPTAGVNARFLRRGCEFYLTRSPVSARSSRGRRRAAPGRRQCAAGFAGSASSR